MAREDERNNCPTQPNVRRAVREPAIVCLLKGIGERIRLAFAEHCELIVKYHQPTHKKLAHFA
jgi:hypothetical protein